MSVNSVQCRCCAQQQQQYSFGLIQLIRGGDEKQINKEKNINLCRLTQFHTMLSELNRIRTVSIKFLRTVSIKWIFVSFLASFRFFSFYLSRSKLTQNGFLLWAKWFFCSTDFHCVLKNVVGCCWLFFEFNFKFHLVQLHGTQHHSTCYRRWYD